MAGLSAHAPSLRASRQFTAGRLTSRSVHRPVVIVRADPPGSKVVREYREDDDIVSVPGATRSADGSVYVDDSGPRPKGPTDNMSKEMKQRLRQEYIGLGGAEGQAMNSNYFLWIIGIISVLAVLTKLTGAI